MLPGLVFILLILCHNACIVCSFGYNNLNIMVALYVELNIVQQCQINKSSKTFGKYNKQLKLDLL